jgi:hypothetical protein
VGHLGPLKAASNHTHNNIAIDRHTLWRISFHDVVLNQRIIFFKEGYFLKKSPVSQEMEKEEVENKILKLYASYSIFFSPLHFFVFFLRLCIFF